MTAEVVKVKAGKYLIPLTLVYEGKRIYLKFRYNKAMIAEIKAMDGHHWHGYDDPNPKKIWSIKNNARNQFQLRFLQGLNPYEPFDVPLVSVTSDRPLYAHQLEMVAHGLTRRYCIFACEMGTGKTLAAIEIMEAIEGLEHNQAWYVGPRSGIIAVQRELIKWESRIRPRMFTYEQLTKHMKYFSEAECPKVVIFDESSKIKTPTAQRSVAAYTLAESVRSVWESAGYIILMSGTPAPKVPTDWWHQCEVAYPGFIREGNIHKFKQRLCIVEQRQSVTGGMYPHIVTWLDDTGKCAVCGALKAAPQHTPTVFENTTYHGFVKSVNEVKYLYERMAGLVLVKFKKDCLDLPEKQYEVIRVMPTPEVLRAAKLITNTARRVIEALTMLRELSDGFQYEQKAARTAECPNCYGRGHITTKVPKHEVDPLEPQDVKPEDFEDQQIPCDVCGATGKVVAYERVTEEIGTCPKDPVFLNELDAHDDVGRYIVWGGFTGTIDRLVDLAHQHGWATLRVDGRGFVGESASGEFIDSDTLLDCMDGSAKNKEELLETYPKVCYVGHPQAGGMALTLTASPTELFYSNCFNGEARMQAEDRFHRPGMDENRAAMIKDIIHLPVDELVLENLKKKKKLQNLTMGELGKVMEAIDAVRCEKTKVSKS
jgi:SNF2 family DNA or RNA helicase